MSYEDRPVDCPLCGELALIQVRIDKRFGVTTEEVVGFVCSVGAARWHDEVGDAMGDETGDATREELTRQWLKQIDPRAVLTR